MTPIDLDLTPRACTLPNVLLAAINLDAAILSKTFPFCDLEPEKAFAVARLDVIASLRDYLDILEQDSMNHAA